MNLLFTAPIARPSFDGGTSISGMVLLSCIINPDTLMATVMLRAIEDTIPGATVGGGAHSIQVGPFTGATTLAGILAAIKTTAGTALGVTFQ